MRPRLAPVIGALATTAAMTAALLMPTVSASAQTELIVDTTDSRFSASDNWGTSSWNGERYGDHYRFADPETTFSDPAWYQFDIPSAGSYAVDVWYPSSSGYNDKAPFVIATSNGTESVHIDQRSNGGQWVRLGTFPFDAGDYNAVGVSRWTNGSGYIIADAVRLTSDTEPSSDIRLNRSGTDSDLLAELRSELGTVSVSTVLNSANRTAQSCSPSVKYHSESFCWNSGDSAVSYWMPQGITTTGDATSSGTWNGREALLAAWYDKDSGRDMGVRVSFADMANRSKPDYRHVLLVEPYWDNGQPSFRRVNAHAGGMVWYGDQLYVNNTYNGLRVFNINDLMRVSTGDSNAIGRQSDGSYHAHNYRYVLPQEAHYVPSTTNGVSSFRYSQTGLDRTTSPHSLVVSEYGYPGSDTRMARFDLDESTHQIAEDSDGYARADWVETVGIRSMQGAVSVNGKFHIHRSNGSGTRGDVFIWYPGSTATKHTGAVPIGPEDVSYWPQYGEIWSHTEYPGKRYVYASNESSW